MKEVETEASCLPLTLLVPQSSHQEALLHRDSPVTVARCLCLAACFLSPEPDMDRWSLPLSFLVLLLLCAQSGSCSKSNLIRLDEESWSQLLTGEWMVEL